MMRTLFFLLLTATAQAQPVPALRLDVTGQPVSAVAGARPGCDATDIPDSSARAIRLTTGEVQLYAAHLDNRVESGPDLAHLRHRCPVVMSGRGADDPAAYDDRAWLGSVWTPDGHTVLAVVHNEFHGHLRPALCPSGRYMDCWFNSLTAAASRDGGRSFQRVPGPALVAALPYRYDQVGPGHHGYFGPSNIVTLAGFQYMMAFATLAGAQQPGNCLMRTSDVGRPETWRAWDGVDFQVAFIDPYTHPAPPAQHVCTPVGTNALHWPVTSLVRHQPTGVFIALMLNGAPKTGESAAGVYYATSPDLLHWSSPALLLPATGQGGWTCGEAPPIAYPSLLDPASPDRNFETVGAEPVLFATRFTVQDCRTGMDRELIRYPVRSIAP